MSNAEKRIFNKEFNLPAETFGLYTHMKSVLTLFYKGEEALIIVHLIKRILFLR